MEYSIRRYRSLAFSLLILPFVLFACDNAEDGPPSWDEARIQSRGVDGVEFGQTYADAMSILGQPDQIIIAHRDGISYRGLSYSSGDHSGIELFFEEKENAEFSRMETIQLVNEYDGLFYEEVGLGSNIHDFNELIGPVSEIGHTSTNKYLYCKNNVEFNIYTDSDGFIKYIFYGNLGLDAQGKRNCSEN